jgi:hypothetical protein
LVKIPAIMNNWVAMSKEVQIHLNEDKQLLAGPILIPDQLIERWDKQMGTYYIRFSKEEIEKLVRKFQSEQKTVNLNYEHKENSKIENAVIQEIWLTGLPDKSESYGFNLPEGSAFVVSHIGDKNFWLSEVKTGKVKGYSIEGFLDIQLKQLEKMSEVKLIQANATDGSIIKSDTETWTVGSEVYSEKDGDKIKIEDGDYNLGNGQVLKVVEGKIAEIQEVEAEADVELKKMLKPVTDVYDSVIKELKEKLAALEVKMANSPASKEEKKEEEIKETPYQKLTRIYKSKETSNN